MILKKFAAYLSSKCLPDDELPFRTYKHLSGITFLKSTFARRAYLLTRRQAALMHRRHFVYSPAALNLAGYRLRTARCVDEITGARITSTIDCRRQHWHRHFCIPNPGSGAAFLNCPLLRRPLLWTYERAENMQRCRTLARIEK